jgi:type II secretory pathway component PulC
MLSPDAWAAWAQSRLAQAVAWFVVLALAAWMAWYWFGVFTSSGDAAAPIRSAAPDVQAAAAQAVAAPLFGQAGAGGAGAAAAGAGDIKLRGVFAGAGGLQAAIVNTGKEDSFVALSGEIAPGVVLQEVHTTYILVSRNGLAERVELDVLKSPEGGGAARRREARTPEQPAAPAREETAEAPQPAPVPQPATDSPVPQAVPGGPVPVPVPGAAPPVPVPAPQSGTPGTHEQGYA